MDAVAHEVNLFLDPHSESLYNPTPEPHNEPAKQRFKEIPLSISTAHTLYTR